MKATANQFLIRQLQTLQCLDSDAIARFLSILKKETVKEKGQRWIDEGSEAGKAYVLVGGWAIRYKLLDDGSRQILNFHIPGDIVGYYGLLFKNSASSVEPLTNLTVQAFFPQDLFEVFRQSPEVAVALSWLAGQGERQLNEQLVRIGRRGASVRMAHLFMELNHRLLRVGASLATASLLPLTQTILADALGMSHIHTHRTFRELVHSGLVSLHEGKVKLQNLNELAQLAGFNADYLVQDVLPADTQKALSS